MMPTITSVAARLTSSVISTSRLRVAAEKHACGGEAGERRALDLRRAEGVTGENERRCVVGNQAGIRVRVRDPTVAPAGDGGTNHVRPEAAQPLFGQGEDGFREGFVRVIVVIAAPLRACVDGYSGGFGDALALVVRDRIQRLRPG